MSANPQPADQLSRLLRIAILVALAAFVSSITSCVGVYLALTKKPEVVAATDSGRIIPLVPLNKSYVTDSRVIGFAEECTRRAFAHDFLNYRATVGEASKCFTSNGSKMYSSAMDAMLQEIVTRRLIMTASVEAPVIVTGPLERGGRVFWKVQTKMQLFREGQKERITPQSYIVNMEVIRVELEENTRGISVSDFVLTPA